MVVLARLVLGVCAFLIGPIAMASGDGGEDSILEDLPLAVKLVSAMNPGADGVYVQQADMVHGSPTFTREEEEEPKFIYRSAKGIWVLTNETDDFDRGRGASITAKAGPSPLGLKWRCRQGDKWPLDEGMAAVDYSAEYNEILLRRGPPKLVTRTCTGGSGHASAPDYTYTTVPATFDCMTSSEFCFNDSPAYCNFSKELLAEMLGALDDDLQERSAMSVILEDELDLIDGADQTAKLKKAVQEELDLASYRVFLTDPWVFGLKTYIQVADAILLFSVCASYGVAAGIFFASLYDKQQQQLLQKLEKKA